MSRTLASMGKKSGGDDTQDGLEPVGARPEACGIGDGADIGRALGSPRGAIAVGDFALDHGWPQIASAGIVGGFNLTGPECEGQELVLGQPDPVLHLPGQVTGGRGVDDILEDPLQGAPPFGEGGDRGGLNIAG